MSAVINVPRPPPISHGYNILAPPPLPTTPRGSGPGFNSANYAVAYTPEGPVRSTSGKRRIPETAVAYAQSLELPVAHGKRHYYSNGNRKGENGPHSMRAATLGGGAAAGGRRPSSTDSGANTPRSGTPSLPNAVPQPQPPSPRVPAPISITSNSYSASTGGVVAVVFGGAAGDGGLDGDSSPAMAKRFAEALYADNKLKQIQLRQEAAMALKAAGKGGGDDEELDDEGNPKPKKKRGKGAATAEFSPRKRIEDYLFLKQSAGGKQWCPPTGHNGAIPRYESPKKKPAEGEDAEANKKLTKSRQDGLNERMMKALRRENKKKNKGPAPTPRKKDDGTEMTPEEQAAYERTMVKKLTERLMNSIETSKKAKEVALKQREKEEAKLQKPVKKLDSDEALQMSITKLYTEPIHKKQTEALARKRKEEAAKAKLLHLTRKQQEEAGKRLYAEGVERQRQAMKEAADRYYNFRPASASPTARYNETHEIESKYCPGLEVAISPRPNTATSHSSSSNPRVASPASAPRTRAAPHPPPPQQHSSEVAHIPRPPAHPAAASSASKAGQQPAPSNSIVPEAASTNANASEAPSTVTFVDNAPLS